MASGRPSSGVDLVEQVDGSRAVRRRVRVVLLTIAGALTIAEACAEIGVGRTYFFALRERMLQGAVDALRPRPRGRPRRPAEDDADRRALRARIRELELALRTTQLRSEIALTMPYLLDRAGRKKKAGDRRRASAADPRGPGPGRRRSGRTR